MWKSEANPGWCPCRSVCIIHLFYCGSSCYDSALETVSSPFLLRRCGYDGHDAVGNNVLLHVCRFLSAALHNFYFSEYYAGMRIWFFAHDGRCIRADRKTHCIPDCNETFKLSAGMLRRSCCLDSSRCFYLRFLSICHETDRERVFSNAILS